MCPGSPVESPDIRQQFAAAADVEEIAIGQDVHMKRMPVERLVKLVEPQQMSGIRLLAVND